MTENEAIKVINDKYETFFALSTTNDFDMAMATAINALSEIQQYRAIGTVEEFKALKEKKNILPIATIKISKEDMQKIVDEKVAQIELDIQKIRANTIDEFAEMLKEKYEEHNLDLCLRQNDYYSYANSCIQLENYIDKIAEQMKAGGKNES